MSDETPYDVGRELAQRLLDEGNSREIAAIVAGEHAAAYTTTDEIKDFGNGVLDVLHGIPPRDGAQG